MKKLIIVLITVVVLSLLVFFVMDRSRKPSEAVKIKIGYLPSLAAAQLYVAQMEGFFSKEGLQVDTFEIFSGPETIQALQSKSVDIVFGVMPSAILARANGIKVRSLVGATTDSKELGEHRIVVAHDSPIRAVSDLKGKKIGLVAEPTSDGVALFEFLDAHQLTRKDYEIVKMPHPEMIVALATRSIDAAAAIEPFISQGQINGSIRELGFYYPDVVTEVGTFLVHDEWLASNEDAARRFTRAIRAATTWINSDQARLRAALPNVQKHGFRIAISPDVAQRLRLPGFANAASPDGVKMLAELLNKHGFLKKAVTPADVLASVE